MNARQRRKATRKAVRKAEMPYFGELIVLSVETETWTLGEISR